MMRPFQHPSPPSDISVQRRPYVRSKFLFFNEQKLHIRGVTYGTFRPDAHGNDFYDQERVAHDFAEMAANGINAIRTYTVPPIWLLDCAAHHGLWVMVGLPWEQHITFLDDPQTVARIEERVRAGVRACAGHRAVLCYALGNEIPASIVRWYGRHRVERFLASLYRIAKTEDPAGLVTYVNYPSTEYLQLPFIDLVCFNIYLEQQEQFESYLARLQTIAGDRPLVLAEVGLDSRRNGLTAQAHTLAWQLRAAFTGGCLGAFVFAWTDEWHRGGHDIDDWDFGLTDRERTPKPALAAVQQAFADSPFPADIVWPRISVVVCSYNGGRTIRDCCEGLVRLDYPDFEVIIVDDGSTDDTAGIARSYGFQVISTPNRGLSCARNTGIEAATGEIVAYLDDDARPDPDWLSYLALTFLHSTHAGVGGPNVTPPGDGMIAECVSNAPGGPTHVLLSDREAEHLPGCNMAFRKECLLAIGGFDPQFRVAGDDVDICWRMQQQGWTLGFSPAALVWHHRRNSIRAFWKQQSGYGKAEALLERKWPEKYNSIGYITWAGRIYGKGTVHIPQWGGDPIHHGVWGTRLFQSVYQPAPGGIWSFTQMPEWYLMTSVLALCSIIGLLWPYLLLALPLFAIAVSAPLVPASMGALQASFTEMPQSWMGKLGLRVLTALLYLIQPLARLCSRMRSGLTPWRPHSAADLALPRLHTFTLWSERWRAPDTWLRSVEETLRGQGTTVVRGGEYDRWDLVVPGGVLASVRLLMTVEEHGMGMQLLRFRTWPAYAAVGRNSILFCLALAAGAALDEAWAVTTIFATIALVLIVRAVYEVAAATGALLHGLRGLDSTVQQSDRQQQHRNTAAAEDAVVDSAQQAEQRAVPSAIDIQVSNGSSRRAVLVHQSQQSFTLGVRLEAEARLRQDE